MGDFFGWVTEFSPFTSGRLTFWVWFYYDVNTRKTYTGGNGVGRFCLRISGREKKVRTILPLAIKFSRFSAEFLSNGIPNLGQLQSFCPFRDVVPVHDLPADL